MSRFEKLGDRGEGTNRVPLYQVLKWHAAMVINPKHPYHLLEQHGLGGASTPAAAPPVPTWFKELTYEPVTSGITRIAHECTR